MNDTHQQVFSILKTRKSQNHHIEQDLNDSITLSLYSVNPPVVTAPATVSKTCDQFANIAQVTFPDADAGDSPTIAITNSADPNNGIFSIAADGMILYPLYQY